MSLLVERVCETLMIRGSLSMDDDVWVGMACEELYFCSGSWL